jgi:C1A family cysteine protease
MAKLTRRPASGGAHGGFGWVPDLPDHRDLFFAPDPVALKKLATTPHVDLSTLRQMPPVWDQDQLGSCTAHSVGVSFEFARRKAKKKAMMPARLWIYFQERVIEGTVNEDAGAMIRDGFKVLANAGVPPESDWPYVIANFATPPPGTKINLDAAKHKALAYKRVNQSLTSIKAALVSGFPVSFGFTVYESFESSEVASTGVVPMPTQGEKALGGHAVAAVGYDDPTQRFIVRNSWGTSWGQKGYFTMPYAFLTDPSLASDFWQATLAN